MENKTYSKHEIERILQEEDFEYQRVDLPYGLHTPGGDRSGTSNLIYPDSMEGMSVLDVGTANGFFSFEAEKRNASYVLGVDMKEKRLRHAKLIKDILGSKVEFKLLNIIEEQINEKFDYVLLLNVIHHLHEPFHVLRKLASITNKYLIIEFPTFDDPKFKSHASIFFSLLYNRLPLVGVSSLKDVSVDQTFVFSPSVFRKIFTDHDKLFSRVQIIDSPITGRSIAICKK